MLRKFLFSHFRKSPSPPYPSFLPLSNYPSSSLTVPHHPSCFTKHRHPSSSITTHHSSSSLTSYHPSLSLIIPHHPSPPLTTHHHPSPPLNTPHNPSPPITTNHQCWARVIFFSTRHTSCRFTDASHVTAFFQHIYTRHSCCASRVTRHTFYNGYKFLTTSLMFTS